MIKKPCFPFVLDQKPGLFLNWFLYQLFKRVKFDTSMTEQLRQMQREGTIIYTTKYHSHLDYLLLHYCLLRNRLPSPKIAFGINMSMFLPLKKLYHISRFYIHHFLKHKKFPSPFKSGFYKKALERGETFILCLVNPKSFYRHFIHAEHDQIQFILETQKKMERPVYMVPVLILYKKAPEKEHPGIMDILFGFKDNPGCIRKIVLFFRYHRKAFVDFGTPLNLKEYISDLQQNRTTEEISKDVTKRLIEGIDVQKRVIIGPVVKSRHQIKEIVLKDEDVIKTIKEMSGGDPVKLQQMKKRATAYFDEIASDPNMTYMHFSHIFLSWLWKKMFHGIDIDKKSLSVVRQSARKAPLVYVPSHKSHIDYMILNDILFTHHLPTPQVAAGRNLSFWPIGNLFRKNGAFFIRRSFKGARLYATVFTRYIKAIIEEGYAIEFFIEGGRSRSGKLILPQRGFLSILIEAYQEGYCHDLMFVPSSITYDSIPEQKSYLKEMKGQSKNKENFKQVIKARRILKRKHGKVYIRFAQPISLEQYLSESQESKNNIVNELAMHLVRSINKVTLVTPFAIVATSILARHRIGFYPKELLHTAHSLLDSMKRNNVPISNNAIHLNESLDEVISFLTDKKIISLAEKIGKTEVFYRVEKGKIPELEYYKNTIIHTLISYAFVSTSLLTEKEEVIPMETINDDYDFLKYLFKYEFVYNNDNNSQDEISNVLDFFRDASFVTTIKEDTITGIRVTRKGFENLPTWAALTKTFLESYWIAANTLVHPVKEGKKIKDSDLLKEMSRQGHRYLEMGIINHAEAISYLSFRNATRFIHRDLLHVRTRTGEKTFDPFDVLHSFIQRLYDLSHFTL